MKHSTVGTIGEILVAKKLGAKRLFHAGFDLITRKGTRIEVKTSSQDSRKGFKFSLYKNDKYGYTDCKRSDYLVLVCLHTNGLVEFYTIPTNELTVKNIYIGETSPKYRKYWGLDKKKVI
jgi:hypothetical protein